MVCVVSVMPLRFGAASNHAAVFSEIDVQTIFHGAHLLAHQILNMQNLAIHQNQSANNQIYLQMCFNLIPN